MLPKKTDTMEEESTVVATYIFRGIEYVVTMNVQGGKSVIVEVEDRLTADQWRGCFDSQFIEDLTHKTGNFKQFSIFLSMLESAITQGSDSVSLDLLTYTDLESLRSRKAGVGNKNIPPAKTAASLNSKRYLILTYTVEFDRIHYPLPLPYMGKPDPRALQETVRQLRQELRNCKTQGSKDFRFKELEKLKKDYDTVCAEKEDVASEYLAFRRQVGNTREGSAAKEIRLLKDVIKNLECELLKEKNKQQKTTFKRNQEHQQLQQEVDELRASERNLKVRVKSLTNELAVYKRQLGHKHNTSAGSRRASSRGSYSRDRSGSRENSYNRDTSRISSHSKDSRGSRENSRISRDSRLSRDSDRNSRENSRLSNNKERSYSRDQDKNKSYLSRNNSYNSRSASLTRDRSNSRDRSVTARNSTLTRDRSTSRERPLSARNGSITRDRSTSRERPSSLRNGSLVRDRSSSRERPPSARDTSRSFSRDHVRPRERSLSWERTRFREGSSSRDRASPRGRSRERQGPVVRNRTPSPIGSPGYLRFNPTAFIKEKERKQKETDLKKKRNAKNQMVRGDDRRPKSSPDYLDKLEGFRGRASSIDSLSDILPSDASDGGSRRTVPGRKVRHGSSNVPSSPEISFSKPPKTQKILASTPESEPRTHHKPWEKENLRPEKGAAEPSDYMYFDRTEEISEIDERLNRLQEFMKNNLQ